MSQAVLARPAVHGRPALPLVTLTALGVVYGDIGTSPLYGLKQAAEATGGVTPANVIGVVSVIFWSLIVIISIKYAILILSADNNGEGGIVAMLALLGARDAPVGSWRASLLIVGLVGAALLYGDGAITPAISVLSAIEGLKLDAPKLAPAVVPITVGILIGLFMIQRRGTTFIGSIFGPIMLLWFIVTAVLGIGGIMPIAGHTGRARSVERGRLPGPCRSRVCVRGAGRCVSRGDRRRGDVCRHGPLRPCAYPAGMVWSGAPGAHAELLRAGRAAAQRPEGGRESILSPRTGVGALPDGDLCHDGDDHRVPGDYLRRLFADAAVDPAWFSAAHARAAHGEP